MPIFNLPSSNSLTFLLSMSNTLKLTIPEFGKLNLIVDAGLNGFG